MSVFAYRSTDYKTIYIVADSDLTSNPLTVYHNSVEVGIFRDVPTPTDFTTALLYVSTLTSLGTRYIFSFQTDDIGLTADERFEDGIWHFSTTDGGSTALFGVLFEYGINCCIAKHLPAQCENYTIAADVLYAKAMLESAKASLDVGDMDGAVCKFKMVKIYCDGC